MSHPAGQCNKACICLRSCRFRFAFLVSLPKTDPQMLTIALMGRPEMYFGMQKRKLHAGAPFAVDIGTILAQKLAPVDLLRAVQWTAQYLWFLPSDPSSARLVPYSSILQKLAELHISSLTPSREGRGDGTGGAAWHKTLTKIPGCFSTLQVCMRSVLEALAERLGGLPDADSQQLGAFSWLEAESKAQLPRLFQLCCPLLDQARLALQVSYCFT